MNLTAQARLREWAREVDDWRASGMTQRSWCKTRGMKFDTFKYHKGRVEAFAAGLMKESGTDTVAIPDHALRSACACGAICSMTVGACAGLESREQVCRFLAEAKVTEPEK